MFHFIVATTVRAWASVALTSDVRRTRAETGINGNRVHRCFRVVKKPRAEKPRSQLSPQTFVANSVTVNDNDNQVRRLRAKLYTRRRRNLASYTVGPRQLLTGHQTFLRGCREAKRKRKEGGGGEGKERHLTKHRFSSRRRPRTSRVGDGGDGRGGGA